MGKYANKKLEAKPFLIQIMLFHNKGDRSLNIDR